MAIFTIKFFHREEDQIDQELFSNTVKDSIPGGALEYAELAYVNDGRQLSRVNRITIDME